MNWPLVAAAALAVWVVSMGGQKQRRCKPDDGDAEQGGLKLALIRAAQAQGIDPRIVLAFAAAESGIRNVIGDKHRKRKDLWAYGPLQVTAKWWLHDVPEARWTDTAVNIPAGVLAVKWALNKSGGDLDVARLVYTRGAALAHERDATRDRILARWRPILDRYLGDDDGPQVA